MCIPWMSTQWTQVILNQFPLTLLTHGGGFSMWGAKQSTPHSAEVVPVLSHDQAYYARGTEEHIPHWLQSFQLQAAWISVFLS
mmetsp:Transcript_35369/g.63227  ORF Transcript_35369/g.63227 Transcript_35369/m.63227 type:complete len:83 (-) Transcript_35369:101-349(-)